MIQIDHGFAFTGGPRAGSYVGLVGGVILLLFSGVWASMGIGLVLILGALYILTTRSGIKINKELKTYQAYASYYGIVVGEWKSLEKFTDIAILKGRMSSSMVSRGNARISAIETVYKVYLLTQSHRSRLFIRSFEAAHPAEELMKDLSQDLGLEKVTYNPKKSRN